MYFTQPARKARKPEGKGLRAESARAVTGRPYLIFVTDTTDMSV